MERIAGCAMILVMAEEVSKSEMRQEMSQNVDLGGGAFLQPLAPPSERPDGVLTDDYQLLGGQVPGQGAAYTRMTSTLTSWLFPTAASLWLGAFAAFYLRVVPALLTHDPSQPWGGIRMRLLSDLAVYRRLCEVESRSKLWYHLCVGCWTSGAGWLLLGFAIF